jgi:hypothetical protein
MILAKINIFGKEVTYDGDSSKWKCKDKELAALCNELAQEFRRSSDYQPERVKAETEYLAGELEGDVIFVYTPPEEEAPEEEDRDY